MTLSFLTSCIKYLAVFRARFILLVCAVVMEALYYLGSPLLYKYIFDEGITQGQQQVLVWALALLTMLLCSQALAIFVQERIAATLGVEAANRLRGQLFAKLQKLPPPLVAARSQGDLAHVFGPDVKLLEQGLVRALPPILLYSFVIAASLILLLTINWQLFLVTMAALPSAVLIPKIFSGSAAKWEDRHQKAQADASGFILENIANLPVIRLFHLLSAREYLFKAQLTRLADEGRPAYLYGGLSSRTSYIGTGVTQLIVVAVGALLALSGKLTAGLLIAFIGLLMGIGEAVTILSTAIPLMISAQQAHGRIRAFLDQDVPVLEKANALAMPKGAGRLAFENVNFSHDGERLNISSLNFDIEPGRKIALVGPSGCGKSTVLSLIMRFARPQTGRILLDGAPIDEIDEESLRSQMSVVLQHALLFDATIGENIMAGRPGATHEDMIAAAKAAGIHDAIMAKPLQYDTRVSNSTGALSGGERQRVAVARALLRQAPILLLDEATSALDPESERIVNETVDSLGARGTVISVTHRLSSLTNYDRILVLREGQLVESGNHDELLKRNGLYASLWGRQQGMAITPPESGAPVITTERLALIPFLSECRRSTLEELSGLFALSHYAEGQYVFHYGDAGDRFYLIARGCAEVRLPDGEGEKTVAVLRDGDFFGELALVRNAPRAASIVAVSETWCLSLSAEHFLRIMNCEPDVHARVTQAVQKITGEGAPATPPTGDGQSL